jgi:hypothetical protein
MHHTGAREYTRRKLRGMCLIHSLYQNEYRIFKLVETTIRKGLKLKEEMKQIDLYYIYTWKCTGNSLYSYFK